MVHQCMIKLMVMWLHILVVSLLMYVALFKSRQSLVHSLVNNKLSFQVIITTQQRCINISILLWQHVSVLLDHLHASIQRYDALSVHIMYCGIPFSLQDVHTKYFKIIIIIKLCILKVFL